VTSTSTRMTAQDIRRALWWTYIGKWAVVFEVTARGELGEHDRRIDALLIRKRPTKPLSAAQQRARWAEMVVDHHTRAAERESGLDMQPLFDVSQDTPPPAAVEGWFDALAIEIKVSRSDFFDDIRDPGKQAPWRELAGRHAYCVPAGLVAKHEVPADSGLMEVTQLDPLIVGGGGRISWARTAPRLAATPPIPPQVQLDAFYRWSRAEALTRGLDGAARRDGDDVEKLRADLARTRAELDQAHGVTERLRNRLDVFRQAHAGCSAPPCGTCGRPLGVGRRGQSSGFLTWAHTTATDETVCKPLRVAAQQTTYARSPEPVPDWDVTPEFLLT
jgi:hypothetical protein